MTNKGNCAILAGSVFVCLILLFSCSTDIANKKRIEQAQNIVFNELMPRNRTGLLNGKQKPADWIEIKNTSDEPVSLNGFQLAFVTKNTDDTKGDRINDAKGNKDNKESKKNKKNKKKKGDKKEDSSQKGNKSNAVNSDGNTTWTFPDFTIRPGECVIIFADNGKSEEAKSRTLSAEFKLPKDGGTLQLLSPAGTLIKEMKYGRLEPDQSLALQDDGSYEPTYWQSPGFDNTRDGYEKAMEIMSDQRHDPLKISELMTRSAKASDNWIELMNYGDKEIDLSNYSLSKKLGKNEEYWPLPSRKLQPGRMITIQLAGRHANSGNPLQAPIKPGDSETIVLSRDGKFVDGVCAKMTTIGGSIGRIEGKKGFFYFPSPTRNRANGDGGRRFIARMPRFDKKPGIYPDDKELCLRLKEKDHVVRYTTNGSSPTSASPVMGDSITISRGTVIRAYAEGDSVSLPSNIATATYLPGVKHDLAVMNVTVDNADLYDYNHGIYAKGPGYGDEWPHPGANYWKNWTKNAHVEFFDGKEGFSTDCGIRIFGGFSRDEAKKSFRLKFRGRYGDAKVDYDFFDNGKRVDLKDLVLRSGSQDYNRCMIRDEFFTSLMKAESPGLLIQDYRPVALYVNAEYFGLYYLREKIDKHFVARKLKVPADSISIIVSKGYWEEGTVKDYNRLMGYVKSHDMATASNYEYVKRNVDLQGLIDYKLGEIFSGNTDVGNIRYVRSESSRSDRKWHFVFYDLDATWVGYKPEADFYLSTGGSAAESLVTEHNILINRLLANKDFRALFLERLSHHLATTFSTGNTTAVFDALVARIRPEMKLNCGRWPQLSYNQWEKNLDEFKEKFADKPKIMLNDLRQYLRITDEENKKYFSKLGY